mgnify:CR=1 FL=1
MFIVASGRRLAIGQLVPAGQAVARVAARSRWTGLPISRAFAAAPPRPDPVYEEYDSPGDDEGSNTGPRKEALPRMTRSKADRASALARFACCAH